ncbi:MAG: hypothetical protein K6T83_01305 [Alicyclobacillus sp.]|nr:hypothetical protein [Alicyclobacillus sp.]
MVRCATQTVVLADSSKWGVRAMSVICGLDEIDVLVTDADMPPGVIRRLEDMGIEVLVANAAR